MCHLQHSTSDCNDDDDDDDDEKTTNYNENSIVCQCDTCENAYCFCLCHNKQAFFEGTFESKDLKITFINVNGLGKKSKYPEFTEFINNYDIVGITESNMTENDKLTLEHFFLLKTKERPLALKTSGGITVLVKIK